VGITAGSREVPGRNACDRRHTYRIIIIIIIIIIIEHKETYQALNGRAELAAKLKCRGSWK